MKQRFTRIGETPAHGIIFIKGQIEIVVYQNGLKRYWPNGCPGKCYQRTKDGMDFYFASTFNTTPK